METTVTLTAEGDLLADCDYEYEDPDSLWISHAEAVALAFFAFACLGGGPVRGMASSDRYPFPRETFAEGRRTVFWVKEKLDDPDLGHLSSFTDPIALDRFVRSQLCG